jgi:hypothetical protein
LQTKSLFAESANLEQLEDAVEPQFIPYESAETSSDELSLEPKIIEYDIKEDK